MYHPKLTKSCSKYFKKSEADFSWLQRASGALAEVTGHANSPVTVTLKPRQGHKECPQLHHWWDGTWACVVGTELRHRISPQPVLPLPNLL